LLTIFDYFDIICPKEVKIMAVERVAQNRKARHDYFILDTFECGLVLTGTEIKSVRAGRVNLKDGYAKLEKGELWLMNVHISPYENASWRQHDPTQRPRFYVGSFVHVHKGRSMGQDRAWIGEG
jgi:tmRNA-binding protein